MTKFISKQSVASWYALSALLATFLVGQAILWCFPDRSSMGASLLFILMNLIPMIVEISRNRHAAVKSMTHLIEFTK